MTPDDLSALHALSFPRSRPWSADEIQGLIDTPGVFLVSETRGFAMGRTAGDEAELLTIAVHPDARRCGVGERLLHSFHASAATLGATDAFLEVADDNAAAIALYHKAGYKQAGRRPGYYTRPGSPAADALTLRRALRAAMGATK